MPTENDLRLSRLQILVTKGLLTSAQSWDHNGQIRFRIVDTNGQPCVYTGPQVAAFLHGVGTVQAAVTRSLQAQH